MAGEYLKSSVHVHTKLCDGKNTPEELAVTAWRAGLQTLGFTGHSYTPCDLEYCMTQSRTALYKAQIAKLKERYAGKLDILCGLEWDLESTDDRRTMTTGSAARTMCRAPRPASTMRSTGARATWPPASPTILTATAWLWSKRTLPTSPKWPRKSPPSWATSTSSNRYTYSGKFFDEQAPRYHAAAEAALMAAARNRCVLEVNTSAVFRGFRQDFFPSDAILKDWLALSGNVVITADAHKREALTFGFEEAAAKLKALGYTKVQVLGRDGFTPCAL